MACELYIYIFLILLFFQGCVTTTNTINRADYKPSLAVRAEKKSPIQIDSSSMYDIEIQTVKKAKDINFSNTLYNGSIKGIISNLKFDKTKKLWIYEIRGVDISNAKLPYAKFYNSKKLANEGDFVYVILVNSKLKDLFFIKKGNKLSKKTKFAKKRKVKKRKRVYMLGKRKISPKIGVPTVENVTF